MGWRAAAANLSDLAAMGATEVVGITVGLVAPASTSWSWVEGVYQGLGEALQTHGGVLLVAGIVAVAAVIAVVASTTQGNGTSSSPTTTG